jgi:hypothetical protein
MHILLAYVSKGCNNETEHIFILILKPFFIFFIVKELFGPFPRKCCTQRESGYQEPFYT